MDGLEPGKPRSRSGRVRTAISSFARPAGLCSTSGRICITSRYLTPQKSEIYDRSRTIIQFSSSAAQPVSSSGCVVEHAIGNCRGVACLRCGCGELHSSFDPVTIGFPSRAAARRPGSSLTIQW